jgi:two-component system, cell cycle sensor histidine kinase and response regulator CckA
MTSWSLTPIPKHQVALRYLVAVLLTSIALVLSITFQPWIQSTVFIFFYITVFAAAILGGFGPGVMTAILGTLLGNYFVIPPYHTFAFDPSGLLRSGLFLFFGLLASALSEASTRALQGQAETERRFMRMADAAPILIWMSDPQGARTFFNQPWLNFRGCKMEEETGEGWLEGLHAEDRERYVSAYAAPLKDRKPMEIEYRLRRHDGVYRWMIEHSVPRFQQNGEFEGYIGSCKDFTARKEAQETLSRDHEQLEVRVKERTAELAMANKALRAEIEERSRVEQALRESEERYRLLINDVQDYAIYLLDQEGRVRSWNLGAGRIYGYDSEEILGLPFETFYAEDSRRSGKPDGMIRVARTDGRSEAECWHLRKDGTPLWVDVTLTALRDAEEKVRGFSVIIRDKTERRRVEDELKQKEDELYQSRKLEAVGRLAGGVAHDFNNLITGIIGISQDLQSELPPGDHRYEDLEEIIKAANRASGLTKQLLAFGRRQVAAPIVVNLNTIIKDMDRMLRRLIGEDLDFVTVLDPDLGNVKADPGQLEQIIINLVLNSRDAMGGGGKITIQTSNVELTEDYAKRHFELKPGPHILFTVSDTGSGMDPETQAHIFEPFFTTKSHDKGTGLGLATVYGIVKQNGGDILFYSNPGTGTTFKIYLPRVSDPAMVDRRKEPRGIIKLGTETILVVEDESIVRRTAVKSLHKLGYTVLEAANGKEALEVCASYHKPIHLLLTDVIMPGLNGRQLAEMVSPNRPEMKILYMSGYTENIIVQRGLLKPGIAFIEKSFTSDALSRKVREVLDAPFRPAIQEA